MKLTNVVMVVTFQSVIFRIKEILVALEVPTLDLKDIKEACPNFSCRGTVSKNKKGIWVCSLCDYSYDPEDAGVEDYGTGYNY